MTNITALRIQGERLGRGEGVHSWHHDTCVRGNLNSSPFLISIPKQKDLLWSLKSHFIRILRGYQPCIIIPPKANNQVSIRTNTLHALARMPLFTAVTLPPCGSGSARADPRDGVTGDRQWAMGVTLTFLAGASRAAWAAGIARGTPEFKQWQCKGD